jgi:hypothetical protein
MKQGRFFAAIALAVFLGGIVFVKVAFGQGDILEKPMVNDASRALAQGDVAPVLKWVNEADEGRIKEAFKLALEERKNDPAAADSRFIALLASVHNRDKVAVAGAGDTGKTGRLVEAADASVETGSIESIKEYIPAEDLQAIQDRLNLVVEKKKRADENLEAGREFVAEYTRFLGSLRSLSQETGHFKR